MSSLRDSAFFFKNGNSKQFEFCLKTLYPSALKLKANKKGLKKPEELVILDTWYREEFPEVIAKRGKGRHMIYEELIKAMRWKQARDKLSSKLVTLIQCNRNRDVMVESKKAFKKMHTGAVEQALKDICNNLKGINVTMASAYLAAASPEQAPYMSDECYAVLEGVEGNLFTTAEYLSFVEQINEAVKRLNASQDDDEKIIWTMRNVEFALWAHIIVSKLSPSLLEEMPGSDRSSKISSSTQSEESCDSESRDTDPVESSDETNQENSNPPIIPEINGSNHGDSNDWDTETDNSNESGNPSGITPESIGKVLNNGHKRRHSEESVLPTSTTSTSALAATGSQVPETSQEGPEHKRKKSTE